MRARVGDALSMNAIPATRPSNMGVTIERRSAAGAERESFANGRMPHKLRQLGNNVRVDRVSVGEQQYRCVLKQLRALSCR
jgi:hypothetical protein